MKSVAVVDLSWLMHKNRHALSDLTYTFLNAQGIETTIPTGHIYGTVSDIKNLSQSHDLVLLVLDSICKERSAVFSGYKAGRRSVTGDPVADYNIFNDLLTIVGVATSFRNVLYTKLLNYEADDIIAALIQDTPNHMDKEYHFYFNDDDILQNPGVYFQHTSIAGKPVDRYIKIMDKYGYGSDYLPLFHKVIRGDSSDKIPPAIPRFPSKLLHKMFEGWEGDWFNFEDIVKNLQKSSSESKTWAERLKPLSDTSSELYKALSMNFEVVHPRLPKISEIVMKKRPVDVAQELSRYGINPDPFI